MSRYGNITSYEIEKAFQRANEGLPTLLGIFNHDFRNMVNEIEYFCDLLYDISRKYNNVSFKFATAKEAFNAVLQNKLSEFDLNVRLKGNELYVDTIKGCVFGPQPYLAIKTKSGKYIHDNFDFGLDGKSWSYVFDENMIKFEDVDTIGVAANDMCGQVSLKCIKA